MMQVSLDENRLVTDGGIKAVFVPYRPGENHNCGGNNCLLHISRTGECVENGGKFHCVGFTRKDKLIGYWKEAR